MKPIGCSPWAEVAHRLFLAGLKELPGPDDSEYIIRMHAFTSLAAKDDETSWCASFVCFCLEVSGFRSPRSARARHFINWGRPLAEPEPGCIVVLERPDAGPTAGHIGFFLGFTSDQVILEGGNQSNAVTVALFPRVRILGYRVPYEVEDLLT